MPLPLELCTRSPVPTAGGTLPCPLAPRGSSPSLSVGVEGQGEDCSLGTCAHAQALLLHSVAQGIFMTPWTIAHQAPLSMRFSRQEYWRGLPFPLPGDLPDSGIKPASLVSPALAGGFFTTSTTGEALPLLNSHSQVSPSIHRSRPTLSRDLPGLPCTPNPQGDLVREGRRSNLLFTPAKSQELYISYFILPAAFWYRYYCSHFP